ncbi:Histone-lysine N-methyltransferase SETMAR [Strongyloides ratti]|uniref:Histone-lysine N-methyltransferase SETMAR n=1 Tax=Strongyloides ratti TaxID=34506 RepID=A0A090MP53_STRRB|nr:Histone-lysine N-methyltransferase SETMAR [Strongyloides ratti]CEF59871.1 Histone-lysine N-methyltransferase SETMAR [Strongyloides ratti]
MLSKTNIRIIFSMSSKEGRMQQERPLMEGIKDYGRPTSTVNNNDLNDVIEEIFCETFRKVSKVLGVSIFSVFRHLQQIGKAKKLDQWIPHKLNKNQKIVVFNSVLLYC